MRTYFVDARYIGHYIFSVVCRVLCGKVVSMIDLYQGFLVAVVILFCLSEILNAL